MKKITIIIPAYNESENIVKTVESIREKAPGFDYIIVNDCSRDATREICESRGYPILNLPLNLGIGGAVQTGETTNSLPTAAVMVFAVAGATAVVILKKRKRG